MKNKALLVIIPMLILISCLAPPTRYDSWKGIDLLIFHIGDTHAHLDSSTLRLLLPGEETVNIEAGGFSRIAERKRILKKEIKSPSLFFHAGDILLGTLYYSQFGGEADFTLLKKMKLDALTLGNHEFDAEIDDLTTLLRKNTRRIEVVSANINAEKKPFLEARMFEEHVFMIKGEAVGIFGLTTPETANTSSGGKEVSFQDIHNRASAIVGQLRRKNVNKIIALTHIGYDNDIMLAQKVSGIDVIVGGHSHTLLGDYSKTGLVSRGDYPTVITNGSEPVLILHSWENSLMLGAINISFDASGRITNWQSYSSILLGTNIQNGEGKPYSSEKYKEISNALDARIGFDFTPKNKRIERLLSSYRDKLEEAGEEFVTVFSDSLSHVRVPGEKNERGEVMEYGSEVAPLVASAYLWYMYNIGQRIDGSIINAGSVRESIKQGPFSVADAYRVLPFNAELVIVEVSGIELKALLNKGASMAKTVSGAFPYVSGLRYTYHPNEKEGAMISDISVLQPGGTLNLVHDARRYRIVVPKYIADGGDGYSVLSEPNKFKVYSGAIDTQAFIDFISTKKSIMNTNLVRISIEN